jgi:hypothetical protein
MYLIIIICAMAALSMLNLMGTERTRLIAKSKLDALNSPAPTPPPATTHPAHAAQGNPVASATSAATVKK